MSGAPLGLPTSPHEGDAGLASRALGLAGPLVSGPRPVYRRRRPRPGRALVADPVERVHRRPGLRMGISQWSALGIVATCRSGGRPADVVGAPRGHMPDVVYVVGAGHSGSTLLDILLSQHPSIEGVGELVNLYRAKAAGEYCACGVPVAACGFWTDVEREWVARVGRPAAREFSSLQRRFERLRSWPRLVRESRGASLAFREYAWSVEALFTAIRSVSGRPLVMDSSKYPSQALALSLVDQLDLRVLHLVRDVRAVAWSLRRTRRKDLRGGVPRDQRPRPVARAAAFWVVTNLLAEDVCRRLGPERSMRVRYEDLMTQPAVTVRAIGALVAVDLSGVGEAFAAGTAVAPRHTVAGNRLRMAPGVRLEPDIEWRGRMLTSQRWTAWLIAGGLMRRYGYGWDGRAGSPAPGPACLGGGDRT